MRVQHIIVYFEEGQDFLDSEIELCAAMGQLWSQKSYGICGRQDENYIPHRHIFQGYSVGRDLCLSSAYHINSLGGGGGSNTPKRLHLVSISKGAPSVGLKAMPLSMRVFQKKLQNTMYMQACFFWVNYDDICVLTLATPTYIHSVSCDNPLQQK
jgi:hypothetical protein